MASEGGDLHSRGTDRCCRPHCRAPRPGPLRPGPPRGSLRRRVERLYLLLSELRKFTKWLAHSTGPAYVANAVRNTAGTST